MNNYGLNLSVMSKWCLSDDHFIHVLKKNNIANEILTVQEAISQSGQEHIKSGAVEYKLRN